MKVEYRRIITYLIAGSIAAGTDIGLFFVFMQYLRWYYLVASALSFCAGFVVSFLLQKFWTFEDNRMHVIHYQLVQFAGVGLLNLGVNSLALYVLVDHFGVLELVSKVTASLISAFFSFFIYKYIIFRKEVSPANAL
jgi:putative flippase GtrA